MGPEVYVFCIYLYLYLYMMINFHIAPPRKNEGNMGGSPGVSRKKIAATIHCNIAIQVGNDLRKHNQIGHCVNFLPLLLAEPTSSQSFGSLVKGEVEDHN